MILTVDEVKTHLRIEEDVDDEDDYIEGLIEQAQEMAESYCRVSFEPIAEVKDEDGNVTTEGYTPPKAARLACMLMVSHLFEFRDGNDSDINEEALSKIIGGTDAYYGLNQYGMPVIVANVVREVTEEIAEQAAESLTGGRAKSSTPLIGSHTYQDALMLWNMDNMYQTMPTNIGDAIRGLFGMGRIPSSSLNEDDQREIAKAVSDIVIGYKNGQAVDEDTLDVLKDVVETLRISAVAKDRAGNPVNGVLTNQLDIDLDEYKINGESTYETLLRLYNEMLGNIVPRVIEEQVEQAKDIDKDTVAQAVLDSLNFAGGAAFEGMSPAEIAASVLGDDWYEKYGDVGAEVGGAGIDGAAEELEDGDLSSPAEDLSQTAEDGMAGLPDAMGEIAENAVDTIANTLKSDASKKKVYDAASELVGAAEKGGKNEAMIASPSKVWRYEIGEQLAAGLGIGLTDGIDKQMPVIRNAMNYLTNDTQRHLNYVRGASYGDVSELLQTLLPAMRAYQNTYTSNSNLNVQNMYMQNDLDAQALAEQMAAANRRIQAGYGARK